MTTIVFAPSTSEVKPKRMDKRFTGHEHFDYHITFHVPTPKLNFHDVRAWCWSQWGPSKELDDWLNDDRRGVTNCQNPYWCWTNDQYRRRIILKSQEEAALFTLTFGM